MRKYSLFFFLLLVSSCHPKLANQPVGDAVGEWTVKAGQIIPANKPNDQVAQKYWQNVNQLLPADSLAKYVSSLRLYTDGPEEDLAGMVQIDDYFWQLDLDTTDVNFERTDSAYVLEYHHTLIHEFGHLLSLNASQIEPTEDEYQDETKGYLTSEGYARPNSYLAKFVAQFWNGNLLFEWDEAVGTKSARKREKRLFDYYFKYPERFASAYAAEAPEEDLAEAWTFFVLGHQPKGDTVKERKVRFFSGFPELVRLRNDIRARLPFIPLAYLERFEPY